MFVMIQNLQRLHIMEPNKNDKGQPLKTAGADFFERSWKESWTYIKTVVDVVHEPVLILDKNLRVMSANEPFYRMFQVEQQDTIGRIVYELGNGQWNIPALRKLLEDILPENTFFKGFEVVHEFPFIGRKTMILNARQIHFDANKTPSIILLAMEDVTEMMAIAESLALHTNQLEAQSVERIEKLEVRIGELEKEIGDFQNQQTTL